MAKGQCVVNELQQATGIEILSKEFDEYPLSGEMAIRPQWRLRLSNQLVIA